MPSLYEFFAGGGMARLGLGPEWSCLFANDFDFKKAAAYQANFGGDELKVGDVREVRGEDLPGRAELAWAPSPARTSRWPGSAAG